MSCGRPCASRLELLPYKVRLRMRDFLLTRSPIKVPPIRLAQQTRSRQSEKAIGGANLDVCFGAFDEIGPQEGVSMTTLEYLVERRTCSPLFPLSSHSFVFRCLSYLTEYPFSVWSKAQQRQEVYAKDDRTGRCGFVLLALVLEGKQERKSSCLRTRSEP